MSDQDEQTRKIVVGYTDPYKHRQPPTPIEGMESYRVTVTLRQCEKGLALSIVGNNGQDVETLLRLDAYAEGWSETSARHLHDLWQRWHLNDLRAGCVHQRDWPVEQQITLSPPTVFYGVYELEKQLRAETVPLQGARLGQQIVEVQNVWRAASGGRVFEPRGPHLWTEEQRAFLAPYVTYPEKDRRTAPAGHVHFEAHPDGLLNKPCATCGYRYGSAWLHEPLPAEVEAYLRRIIATGRP